MSLIGVLRWMVELVCVDVFLLEVYSKWVGGVADKGVSATISESKLLEV